MAQGKAISEDVQRIIVRMAATLPDELISMYTGVSIRKVQEIRRYFDATGMLKVPQRSRPKSKRAMSDEDIEVWKFPFYLFKH